MTTGLLVVHRGDIVHEDYRLGADETFRFTSWSVAKSMLSALIGIAVDEGHIDSIRDPIGRYVPGLVGSAYETVPIDDALTMSSARRTIGMFTGGFTRGFGCCGIGLLLGAPI